LEPAKIVKHPSGSDSRWLQSAPRPEEVRGRRGCWNLQKAEAVAMVVEEVFHQIFLGEGPNTAS
jgi:hypothetical protein